MGLQGTWCTWRDCESSDILTAENSAIEKVLKAWDSLTGITGGALMVAGKMAAYTVAEPLGNGTLVIHFEKGDPSYKGVYQAINQQFGRHAEAFTTSTGNRTWATRGCARPSSPITRPGT